MVILDHDPGMHHKSDIRKFSKHFMKENGEKQYQGHWTLGLVASYVRHTSFSVQCTDRAFRLNFHSNQNDSKQTLFPKEE